MGQWQLRMKQNDFLPLKSGMKGILFCVRALGSDKI
jgi:hypothetical protein